MNIEELKDERDLLENNIRQLINEFNIKTNLSIYSVSVDMICNRSFCEKAKYTVNNVRVLVDL